MRVHIVRWSFYLRWCLFLVPISKSPIPLRVKKFSKVVQQVCIKMWLRTKDIFKEIYILFCGGNSAASKALRKICLVAFYHEFSCPGFSCSQDKREGISNNILLFFTLSFYIYLHLFCSFPVSVHLFH